MTLSLPPLNAVAGDSALPNAQAPDYCYPSYDRPGDKIPTICSTMQNPTVISASINKNLLTLQLSDVLNSRVLPNPKAFTLSNGARNFTPSDVIINGSQGIVELTFDRSFDSSQILELSYFDLASDGDRGVVESADGADLLSFTGFAVSNQAIESGELELEEGEYFGNEITLFLNDQIRDVVPSIRRFNVKVGDSKKSIKVESVAVEPEDGVVVLTTNNPALEQFEDLIVKYKDPRKDQSRGVIEDLSGNDMESQSLKIANPNFDIVPPTVVATEFEGDRNTITLEFDEIIDISAIKMSRFKVRNNGRKIKVVGIFQPQADEASFEVLLKDKHAEKISLGDDLQLTYKDPKGDQSRGVIQDLAGNDVLGFNSPVDIF